MPTLTSTDALAEALVQQLKDALPDLATAQGLPAVTEVFNYDPSWIDPTKAPYLWVDVVDDQYSADEKRGATTSKYSRQISVHVGLVCAGPDPETTVRQLRTFVDLIRQAMHAKQDPTAGTLWVRWRRTQTSPNLSDESGLTKVALLTFDVNRRATNSGD